MQSLKCRSRFLFRLRVAHTHVTRMHSLFLTLAHVVKADVVCQCLCAQAEEDICTSTEHTCARTLAHLSLGDLHAHALSLIPHTHNQSRQGVSVPDVKSRGKCANMIALKVSHWFATSALIGSMRQIHVGVRIMCAFLAIHAL